MSKIKVNNITPFSGEFLTIEGSGLYIPSLTSAERDQLGNVQNGLLIYNTDVKSLETYDITTDSWTKAYGLSSLNGLTNRQQILNTGAAGTAPNWSQSGDNINTINIPQASSPGVTSGLISKADYDSFNSRLFPDKNIIYVTKGDTSTPNHFSSLKAAVDSITDSSVSNQYLIKVGIGTYVEDTIVMKPYIAISGAERKLTVIQAKDPTEPVFIACANAAIYNLAIVGATYSYGIYFSPTDVPGIFYASNCQFDANQTHAYCHASFPSVPAFLQLETPTIGASAFTNGFVIDNANNAMAYLIVTNFGFTTVYNPPAEAFIKASGVNTLVLLSNVYGQSNGGTFTEFYDGTELDFQSISVKGLATGLHGLNNGAAPKVKIFGLQINQTAQHILIEHPLSTGSIEGSFERSKTSLATHGTISISYTDPVINSFTAIGALYLGDTHTTAVDVRPLLEHGTAIGLIQGGDITPGSGLSINVEAGFGYVMTADTGTLKRYDWSNLSIALPANTSSYIYVNVDGVLSYSSTMPNTEQNILFGRVVTDSAGVEIIDTSPFVAAHASNRNDIFNRYALGSIYDSGSIVTESGTRKLNISSGIFYFSGNKFQPVGISAGNFVSYFRNSGGSTYTKTTTSTVDNSHYDDGSGTLAVIAAGKYVKHSLYIVGDDDDEKYMLVYGQNQFSTLTEAEQGNIPSPPSYFTDGITLIASIIVKGDGNASNTTYPNLIEIRDERPVIGFKASGISASSTHGNLLGLDKDDHKQYLLGDGSRAMSGSLDMAGNNILNAGTVNGVDVTAHASRHLPNGADPLATAAGIGLSATGSNAVGTQNALSRADHGHAIATGAASSQIPDQTNAAGTSGNLARADHVHNIPTAAPSGSIGANNTNTQGIGATFSRSDHIHAVSTAAAATQNPDQVNAAGTSNNLARADHVHNIPTAAASSLNAGSINTQGGSTSFSRADHTHAIASGAASTQAPDQANGAGTSVNFARADHVHNIPTAAAAAQAPDQTSAVGTSSSFARADHVHNIPTAAATSISTSTANAQGSATSFARADHTHAVTVTNFRTSSSTVITTLSTTDTLMTGMALTPAAGTYRVTARAVVSATSNNRLVTVSIYSNGVQVADTAVTVLVRTGGAIGSGDTHAIYTDCVVTVNGSQTIDLRWNTSGGTANASPYAINLEKLS
jgi:hypothetical protein